MSKPHAEREEYVNRQVLISLREMSKPHAEREEYVNRQVLISLREMLKPHAEREEYVNTIDPPKEYPCQPKAISTSSSSAADRPVRQSRPCLPSEASKSGCTSATNSPAFTSANR